MRGSADQQTARSDVLLFLGCAVLGLVAMALPHTWTLSFAAKVRQTVLRPIVALQARAVQDRTARFQLASIQHSRDSLALLVGQQFAIRRENENLRALLGVRARPAQATVAADVLHQPTITDARMLLLDVGSAEGVHSFDAVITADGLIGAVISLGPHSSAVMTWVHPDFAASAVTADGRVFGFLHSSRSKSAVPILELQGVALRDSLAVGTVVMTAGAGGTYPHGIPVGRIVSVAGDTTGYDRVYHVVPFASPGDASHVVILIGPRDSVTAALPPRAPPP
jgi:rod shape-determining protein MreC